MYPNRKKIKTHIIGASIRDRCLQIIYFMRTTVFSADNEKKNKPTSLNTAVASNETLSSCYKRAAFVGFYFFIGN